MCVRLLFVIFISFVWERLQITTFYLHRINVKLCLLRAFVCRLSMFLAFFQEFFWGIYCYANFYCYDNFSIPLDQISGGKSL